MLDCDAVYHQMLRTDPALRGAIERAFGPVFGPDGALDRQKLGNIVFSDPAALERLNAIVYEYLPPELMRRAATDAKVREVIDAFHYRVAKEIGAMAAAMKGQVDQIILTGGIAYSEVTCDDLRRRAGWIADFVVYPGEDELLALVQGGLRVMKGEEEAKEY